MAGARRSRLAADAQRRTQEQRLRVAAQVRSARERRGWTQQQLAARAGVGRLVISRLERGMGRLDLELLQRVALAFGLALAVQLDRDLSDGPVDAGHLAIQELVLRHARRRGLETDFEHATRPMEPWRSIDVVIVDESRRRILVVECWNSIGDVGAAARTSARKLVAADAAAVARFGSDGRAALVWVVRATARNRRLIQTYPEVFSARFPGSSRQWTLALTDGSEPPTTAGLVWSDIGATRLFAWRR